MRYVVEENTVSTNRFAKIKYFDDINAAIDFARKKNKEYKAGTAEHWVKDLRIDSVKYKRGWLDRTLVIE